MNRGDVPFYFKIMADKNLYWLKEKESLQTEELVGIFQRDIDRHANYQGAVWTQDRLHSKFLTQGLLFILKHFNLNTVLSLSDSTSIRGNLVSLNNQIFTFA